MPDLLKHYRRIDARPRGGQWKVKCDCGWIGAISLAAAASPDGKVKGRDIERLLDIAFKGHLPAHERRLYLLADQRVMGEDDDGNPIFAGNFVMPEGTPLLGGFRWYESEGMNYAMLPNGEHLPIGEIRTAEGRVFKYDGGARVQSDSAS